MLAAATKRLGRAAGAFAWRPAPLLSAHRSLVSTDAAAAPSVAEPPKRNKLKIPTKRAAALLQQLEAEAVASASKGKEIEAFKPGDSVEVQYLLSRTGGRVQRVKGVVLARRNRGTSSSFVIRNVSLSCVCVRVGLLCLALVCRDDGMCSCCGALNLSGRVDSFGALLVVIVRLCGLCVCSTLAATATSRRYSSTHRCCRA